MTGLGRAALLAAAAALLGSGAAAEDTVRRVHEVQPGETLWSIAADALGNPHRWPVLYRANRDQIKDPSRVYPGQKLAIPPFEAASGAAASGEFPAREAQ